jgi:hypothetical protein
LVDVQIIDTEGVDYNSSSECRYCQKTIYWNNACRNRATKKKCPLDNPYIPAIGSPPRPHDCLKKKGTTQRELDFTICKFCKKPNTSGIHDCSYKQLVLHDDDTPAIRQIKMKRQDRIKGRGPDGLTDSQRWIRDNPELIAKHKAEVDKWLK